MTVASEWQETTIGALASVTRGASPRPIASTRWFDVNSDVRWVRIADVNRSDGRTLRETTQALSPDGIARSRFLRPGTLIMSIAATVGIPVITGTPTCIHDGFVALENLKADQRFLLYLLKASERKLREAGQSGSQMNVNTDIVKSLPVRIPTDREEQERVASTLWDVDDLIASLECVISKRQAVKQGMMQQLLTGKARLPGFTGEWQDVSVGDLTDQHRSTIDPRQARRRRFQHFSLPAFDESELPVSELGSSIDSIKFVVPPCAVLVSKLNPRIPRIWAPEAISADAIASTEFIVMTPRQGTDRSFIKWLMKSNAVVSRMKLLATGTTGSHARIHPRQVAAIEVRVPEQPEQVAVAGALDDAEREIGLLRRRLSKARDLKQGMMQELLAGRTRLPVEEGVA
jgi:type I restriction enzyme, S subunit